jgi:hypothetical protein
MPDLITTRAKLKRLTGWFAAGKEVASAMELLSDGAFKLYIFLCLTADRSSARLEVDQAGIAKSLAKSRRSVIVYFEELVQRGVCEVKFATNQHSRGMVRICDEFYVTTAPLEGTEGRAHYTRQIRSLLETRNCVLRSFTPADEKLAHAFFSTGIPFEHIERAFLLGCTRKYISWLNGQSSGPIAGLQYFRSIIEEVAGLQTSSDYWRYLGERLEKFENAWLARISESSGHAP